MAPRGIYRQIAEHLRRQIASGDLPSGAMVPSESALVEQYGVARGTVRSALAMLENQGLIEPVPGQGRRVVGESDEHRPSTAYEQIADDLRRRIEAGDFPIDVPLPSEAAIVAEYQVSRNTARRAYRHLADSGLVIVRHGSGAFPAPRSTDTTHRTH